METYTIEQRVESVKIYFKTVKMLRILFANSSQRVQL